MMKSFSILFTILSAFILTSCGQGDVLYVDKAVINLSPVEGNPSSGYLEIHGGRTDVSLVAVTSDDVLRIEMHETVEKDGMMTMQPLKEVKIPSGETVKFEAGGKHLMVWGVGGGSIAQKRLKLLFIFSNDERIEVDALVRKIGDAPAEDTAEESSTE